MKDLERGRLLAVLRAEKDKQQAKEWNAQIDQFAHDYDDGQTGMAEQRSSHPLLPLRVNVSV